VRGVGRVLSGVFGLRGAVGFSFCAAFLGQVAVLCCVLGVSFCGWVVLFLLGWVLCCGIVFWCFDRDRDACLFSPGARPPSLQISFSGCQKALLAFPSRDRLLPFSSPFQIALKVTLGSEKRVRGVHF